MKKLPVGTQNFSEFYNDNYIYVDKTKEIYEMVTGGSKKCFLSRPRRFGKSLLVSTLKELFQGNKKLFEGLYIYNKWNWEEKYPVIHINFQNEAFDNSKELKQSLFESLDEIANKENIEIDSQILKKRFRQLIIKLSEKYDQEVVVLVDEYDKAILDNINDYETAESIRKLLRMFYGVLKGSDEYIKFVFITGVTKFSKTSIFSDLNLIKDLTLNPDFATICGYRQEELEDYFCDYISILAGEYDETNTEILQDIKEWYNGFSWNGKDFLYNPYAIILLFDSNLFNYYWFDTGTPDFLVRYLEKGVGKVENLLNKEIAISGEFPNFSIRNLDLKTLLLQTGYLTIKKHIINPDKTNRYILNFPNKEVHDAFFSMLLDNITTMDAIEHLTLGDEMRRQILSLDNVGLRDSLTIIMNTIPFDVDKYFDENLKEATYQAVYASNLRLLGFDITVEQETFKGRMDANIKENGKGEEKIVVVLEFKFSKNKSPEKLIEEARNTIYDKKHYAPFLDYDKIILLEIGFKYKEKVVCNLELLNKNKI